MTEQLILRELHELPEAMKVEVLHFVQFLRYKQSINTKTEISEESDWAGPMELVYTKDLETLEAIAGTKIKR